MDSKKTTTALLCALLSNVIFGLSFMFSKDALNSVSALTVLSWRFSIAFAAFLICAALGVIKLRFKGKRMGLLLMMALFQPILYFIGETLGISLTTASESGTVIASIPVVTLILSALVLKEKPTRLQTAGIIVSVAGVIIIVLVKGASASFNPLGYAMLVLAVLSDALYVVISRKASEFTSVEKTFIMAAVGTAVFTGGALVEHGTAGTLGEFIALPFNNTDFLFSVLYLAFGCSVAAFLMSNYSISTIGPSRTTSFAGIVTVVSVLSGVIFLRERFVFMQGVGTVLVLLGVYAANAVPKGAKVLPREALDKLEEMRREEEQ